MTTKKRIILLLIVVLIGWLLFQEQEQDKDTKLSKSIRPEGQISETSRLIKPKIKKQTKQVETDATEELEQNTYIDNKLNTLTYLQLYEKSLDAKECYDYYQTQNNTDYGLNNGNKEKAYDFLQSYKNNISYNSNGRQVDATGKQIDGYQNYIERCENLKLEVERLIEINDIDKRRKTTTFLNLRKFMLAVKPVSEEGKSIKTILRNIKQLNTQLTKLYDTNSGTNKSNREEVANLKVAIRKLSTKLASSEFFGDEAKENPKYQELKQQYDEKQKQLKSIIILNPKKLEQQKLSFFNLIDTLKLSLQTKYPSVFNEAFSALNYNQNSINVTPDKYKKKRFDNAGIEFPFISLQILKESPINNQVYFNQLLQPAIELYKCYLGGECSYPNSRHLALLCFIPQNRYQETLSGIFRQACEMSIEEFYLQNFLTDNQVEDINTLFEYFVSHYAK